MSFDINEVDLILLRIMKRIGGVVGVMEASERARAKEGGGGISDTVMDGGFDVCVYLGGGEGVNEATKKKKKAIYAINRRTLISFHAFGFDILHSQVTVVL